MLTRFLLAALLSAVPIPVGSAPVPAPPNLSAELLADATWKWEWGGFRDGVITFAVDGTYFAVHDPKGGPCYVGAWSVERGWLVLLERRLDPATGDLSERPIRYEVALTAADGPVFTGRWCGSAVRLSKPQR